MIDKKINSKEDLNILRKDIIEKSRNFKARVLICMTGCRALGAESVSKAFKEGLENAGLENEVEVVETGCIGLCAGAPVILVEPYEYLYGGVKPKDVEEIIEKTLKKGEPVPSCSIDKKGSQKVSIKEIPFYNKQQKIVLRNCGRISPRKIEDFISRGGYDSALNTLTTKTPEEVIETMIDSELRGRGGAGFPTGVKWKFCRQAPGNEKYLICNADEGDPGAFMDRALLEGDPHNVIEGMIIAAFAIGSQKGFIYVRAEYPIAVEHIEIALKQAREFGLLGKNIGGSGFDFDIEVRMGAGAFVCGEETALIFSLEGKRGMPRPRPPFPAVSGFKGKPTNINNVETFAIVPIIMKNGSSWMKSIGTPKNSGTKIFALAGKVENTGLVEVPMGTTLREIVFDIGGGVLKGKNFKAAQMGGPSGGCVDAKNLDLPIDYDSVKEVGAIMGSGGLIVMDESTCMVDLAKYFLTFVQSESCGKCTPCRSGTKKMLEILEDICEGKASMDALDELEKLGNQIVKTSLCGLGQTAPNPVLSTLQHFRDEYEAHINSKTCPAGVCPALIEYSIDEEKCNGCGLCLKQCPVNSIMGTLKEPHTIDQITCTKCGACKDVCRGDAVVVN